MSTLSTGDYNHFLFAGTKKHFFKILKKCTPVREQKGLILTLTLPSTLSHELSTKNILFFNTIMNY